MKASVTGTPTPPKHESLLTMFSDPVRR